MIYTSCGEVRCAFHDGSIPVGVRYMRLQTMSLTNKKLILYSGCERCIPMERETEPISKKEIVDATGRAVYQGEY